MEPKKEFDLIRLWPLWFGISGMVILGGLVSVFTRGINWGIDFKGGAMFEYRLPKPVPPGPESLKVTRRTRQVLRKLGLQKSQIQIADRRMLVIRTDARDSTEADSQKHQLGKALGEAFPGIHWQGTDMVGPVIGRELKKKAILGTLLGCLFILLYVTIRYEFKFAVAGILALVHDVLVVVGMLSVLQVEVNSAFVAALLTVVGYSINDSVVIFDRIRENMKLRRRDPFPEVANSSLWQTMARSINTVLTTEFVLLSLFLFGGATIHDFALALLIGITSGAYSSIFTASPIVVLWRNVSDRRRRVAVPQRSRQGRPAVRGGVKKPLPSAGTNTASTAAPAAPATTASGPGPETGAAPEPLPRRVPVAPRRKSKSGGKRGKRKRRH